MPKILEICVDSFESAMAAIAGGANRLELCSALSEGGLTPSAGFLKIVQSNNPNKIPVYCMLRCRSGSDFIYTQEECEIMMEDAKILKLNGADGFVFGALKENRDIDIKKCRDIVKTCFPLPVTFHRAFDICKNPVITIECIIDIGFKRILTSGQEKCVKDGVNLIKKLIERANNRIVIMPGCGINKNNLEEILEVTGVKEVHASAKVKKKIQENDENNVAIGEKEDNVLYVTDEEIVRELVSLLNNN